MEYPIHEVARAVGTTTRTLRHYDALGLVHPSRVGTNGYRYYDNHCLVRLQRVLLLRQLGLGLGTIRDVLEAQDATGGVEARILGDHLGLLREEHRRLADQIAAVERTIAALKAAGTEGRNLMSDTIFDGFDHAQYKDEVEQRWGRSSYATSESWWQDLSEDGRAKR